MTSRSRFSIVFAFAGAVVVFLVVAGLHRGRSEAGSASAQRSSGAGSAGALRQSGPAASPEAVPVVSPAEAAAAVALLSDADLNARMRSENAALMRERVTVAQTDSRVAAAIADCEEKDRALQAKLDAHPEIVALADQLKTDAADLSDVNERIQALSNHLYRHGRPADGKPGQSQDVAAAQPSPVEGCEFCARDFDAFIGGDEAVIAAYRKELAALDARRLVLDKKRLYHVSDRKAIEDRLRSSDPEIGKLAQDVDEAAKAVDDALAANSDIARATTWLSALKGEKAKRRAALIDADVANAASRSGRNDQARQEQTNGLP